jgi:hypothetical protein
MRPRSGRSRPGDDSRAFAGEVGVEAEVAHALLDRDLEHGPVGHAY